MDQDDVDRAEEYYNCGYDGTYEPKEKAIIFNCVGRGLRLPPLSKIKFPSFVVKGYHKVTEVSKPSHHVLKLLSSQGASSQGSDFNEENENNYQSSHKYLLHSNSDILSESSSHPVLSTITLESHVNNICSSTSVNAVVCNETSDSEDDDSSTCNLNSATAGSAEDILLAKWLKSFNGASSEVRDSSHSIYPTTKHKDSDEKNIWKLCSDSFQLTSVPAKCSDGSDAPKPLSISSQINPSNKIHKDQGHKTAWKTLYNLPLTNSTNSNHKVRGNQRTRTEHYSEESYLKNRYEYIDLDFFDNHFRTFNPDAPLPLDSIAEFPGLPPKQTQNLLKQSKARNLSVYQLATENSLPRSTNANTDQINHKTETTLKNSRAVSNPAVLIIENLPLNINKEYLKNFLKQFGEILSIVLTPLRDRITAQVRIDSQLERIIRILDGSNPFGAGSQPLRCYQEGFS